MQTSGICNGSAHWQTKYAFLTHFAIRFRADAETMRQASYRHTTRSTYTLVFRVSCQIDPGFHTLFNLIFDMPGEIRRQKRNNIKNKYINIFFSNLRP